MILLGLLSDPEWDAPFFKRLSLGDTGQGQGNSGSVLLPKSLLPYMPVLDVGSISPEKPTKELFLDASMFDGTELLTSGRARYHIQTWGGARPPESRLTRIGPIYKRADRGDILVLQRNLAEREKFRLFLLRRETPAYEWFVQVSKDKGWGAVWPKRRPLSPADVEEAEADLMRQATELPFSVVKGEVSRRTSTLQRIARGAAFREAVRNEYDKTCAVSGIGIHTPDHLAEVQSAHIIPLHEGGSDDLRNGIALTSTLHWAFDQGLFGIVPKKRTVHVPLKVMGLPACAFIHGFSGKQITEARNELHRAHDDAFEWHLDNITSRWEQ